MRKLISLTVFAISAIAAGGSTTIVWDTGTYDPANWSAHENNLILGVDGVLSGDRFYEVGTSSSTAPIGWLTNAKVNREGDNFEDTVGICDDASLSWTWDGSATVDAIRIFTHWKDGGRDGICVSSVEFYSSVDRRWFSVEGASLSYGITGAAYNSEGGECYAFLSRADGGPLAVQVSAVRINLGVQDNNGTGYTEVEVIGTVDLDPAPPAGDTSDVMWRYELEGNDARILGANVDSGCLEIPEQIDGHAVKSIAAFAFASTGISEVKLPKGLVEVCDSAFSNCQALVAATMPMSAIYVSTRAFVGCRNLKNVTLIGDSVNMNSDLAPSGSTSWALQAGDHNGNRYYKSNAIGNSSSTAIQFLTPEGAETLIMSWKVSSEANYDYLTWYLDDVQQGRISGVQDWTTISRKLDGKAHRVRFVYSKDGTQAKNSDCGWVSVSADSPSCAESFLSLFPISPVEEVSFSDGITVLPSKFFLGCWRLKSVALPDSLVEIGSNAFERCAALSSVAISGGVANVSKESFKGCRALNRVETSSLESWRGIQFEDQSDNPLCHGAELFVNGERCSVCVSLDATGGRLDAEHVSVACGSAIGALPQPTKGGFDFLGWFSSVSGGDRINESTVFSSDTTVYAQWARRENLLAPQIFVAEKFTGSTLVRLEAEEGSSIHYTLDGSDPTASSARYSGMFNIASSVSVRAVAFRDGWGKSETAEKYVTKYQAEDDSGCGESFDVYSYGDRVSRTFTVLGPAKVKFNMSVKSDYEYGSTWGGGEFFFEVDAPDCYQRDGMFNWYDDSEYSYVIELPHAGSYTIYWSMSQYYGDSVHGRVSSLRVTELPSFCDVYFDSNGGSACESRRYDRGAVYGMLPTPTRLNGDIFCGWLLNEWTKVDSKREVSSDTGVVVLKAEWANLYSLIDPQGRCNPILSSLGTWSADGNWATFNLDSLLAKDEEVEFTKFEIDGRNVVSMSLIRYPLTDVKVYVDGVATPFYDDKIEVRDAGHHLVAITVKALVDCISGKVELRGISLSEMPQTSTVSFDPNGGVCSVQSRDYAFGDVFGDLPSANQENCEFIGWFSPTGLKVNSTDLVPMVCDKLTAHWKVKPEFLNPDGNLVVEFNQDCQWTAIDGSYASGVPISGGSEPINAPYVRFKVSGRGILIGDNGSILVDGVAVESSNRRWKTFYSNGDRRGLSGDVVYPVLEDGDHVIDVLHSTVYPMRWQALEDTFPVNLNPLGGSISSQVYEAPLGGVYGELPTPDCPWGDFQGWYATIDERWDYDLQMYIDAKLITSEMPVSVLYPHLYAEYSPSGRLFDPDENFDIEVCDEGGKWQIWNDSRWWDDTETTWGKRASWQSKRFQNYDSDAYQTKTYTVMKFTPHETGILKIKNLEISCENSGGRMPVYAKVVESFGSETGLWVSLDNDEWGYSDGQMHEAGCYGDRFSVGWASSQNCSTVVRAGVEYSIVVTVGDSLFSAWSFMDAQFNLTVDEFSFEPLCPVYFDTLGHGRYGEGESRVGWYRMDGTSFWTQLGMYDNVYTVPDDGWKFAKWIISEEGGGSLPRRVSAQFDPLPYEAWYIFDYPQYMPGGRILPQGSWTHAETFYVYPYGYNSYSQCSISGFIASSNVNDRLPNICLLGRDNSTNWIENTVSGPCKVTFDWKVSSEGFHNYKIDYFSFSVDGVEKDWIGGEIDWASREFEVSGTGEHTLRWSYVKDESGAEGEDCGRVANIVIVPLVEIAFQASGQEEYGNPPSSFWLYEGESAPLPGAASLVWPCHELTGWSDGKKTYAVGENYLAGDTGISLVAVWSEKRQSAPVIQVPEKFEAKETQVVMTADAGSTIHYTLDGSEPDESSPCYDGPFSVDCSCVIKAIAIRADWFDSEVVSASTVKAGYTVTFSPGLHGKLSGDVSAQQSVLHGEAAIAPTVIAADWYSFIGWDSAFDCVTADMTVTAMYGLAPRSVEDVECYADIGLSGKNVGAYLDVESRDGCMILLDAADSSVEMKVTGYCRVSCQVRPNMCAIDGAIRIKVDGELYSIVREAGLAVVELNGEGLHAVQWSGLGEVGDFEITDACLISFAGEFGEKGKFPDPIPLYEGDACYLPYPDGVTYDKHTFKCWRYGSNMWFAGDEIVADVNSMAFYAVWDENRLNDPIIVADDYFEGETMTVEIASDEFAEVHYTTDGSVPSDSSPIYTGGFTVNQSCVIKAIAVRENWYASGVSVKQITRGPWTFGEYLGVPDMTFATDGDAEWLRAKGEGPEGSYALKSGHIDNSQSSCLRTTLTGEGVIRFSYRVSSEAYKQFIDDGLVVYLDGAANLGMFGGNTGWQTAEIHVPSGEHVITWSYEKSASDERDVGSDCAWLANISWMPDTPVIPPDPGADEITLGSPYRFAHKIGIMHSSEWYDGLPYEDYILHKGHIEGLANADTFVAIPVYGASGKDAIDPELSYIDASAADFSEVTVVDDKYLFDLIVAPILDKKEEWDNDTYTDFWDHGQTVSMNEYMLADMEKMMSRDFEWDATLWPDDKVVAGRHWILVQMNLPANRLGMAKFKVGLKGKDVLSDECCFLRMAGGDNIDGLTTQGYFDSLCASKWFQLGTGANVGIDGKAQINFDGKPSHSVILPEFKVYNLTHDETFEFKLQIKEAGTLVMTSAQNDELPPNILTISGDNIISDAWRDRWSEGGFEYDIDRTLPDADEKYLEFQYRYGFANQMRKVEVSAGTTLTFTCEDGGSLEMPSMVFYPKTKKSVNVRAIHWVSSETDLYLRGVTTGSDVYCVGDEVVLRAYSGAGEEFVGWKVLYGSLPSGTDLTKKELRFIVTEDMCGTMAEERQLYVQALWSELPMDGITIIRDVNEVRSVFGEHSEVAENITDANQLSLFNEFLAECGIKSVSSITPSQKQFAYKSFKLAEITTAPQLFEEEPVLKIDDLELTGGNLTLTISLTAGAEAIQLAKDKLVEKIRVGTTLGDITGKPTIVASPAEDGTSLTFTITPPEGDQGFVRVVLE